MLYRDAVWEIAVYIPVRAAGPRTSENQSPGNDGAILQEVDPEATLKAPAQHQLFRK